MAPKAAVAKPSLGKLLGKPPVRYIKKNTEKIKEQRKTGVHRASSRKMTRRAPRVRASITPGTVLILLSGAHMAKRVICLGHFPDSGLLLITGPFLINGVPLRRVNQRFVIATSTKIDLDGAGVDSAAIAELLTENPFGRPKSEKNRDRKQRLKNSKSSQFFEQNEDSQQRRLPEQAIARQARIDKPLLAALSKDKLLSQYLKTRFTLRSNMAPHKMVF